MEQKSYNFQINDDNVNFGILDWRSISLEIKIPKNMAKLSELYESIQACGKFVTYFEVLIQKIESNQNSTLDELCGLVVYSSNRDKLFKLKSRLEALYSAMIELECKLDEIRAFDSDCVVIDENYYF